jgi:hypothetical protein
MVQPAAPLQDIAKLAKQGMSTADIMRALGYNKLSYHVAQAGEKIVILSELTQDLKQTYDKNVTQCLDTLERSKPVSLAAKQDGRAKYTTLGNELQKMANDIQQLMKRYHSYLSTTPSDKALKLLEDEIFAIQKTQVLSEIKMKSLHNNFLTILPETEKAGIQPLTKIIEETKRLQI